MSTSDRFSLAALADHIFHALFTVSQSLTSAVRCRGRHVWIPYSFGHDAYCANCPKLRSGGYNK